MQSRPKQYKRVVALSHPVSIDRINLTKNNISKLCMVHKPHKDPKRDNEQNTKTGPDAMCELLLYERTTPQTWLDILLG